MLKRKVIVELINDEKIVIEEVYFWIEEVFKNLDNSAKFINLGNNIIAKNEIRRIGVVEEENNE